MTIIVFADPNIAHLFTCYQHFSQSFPLLCVRGCVDFTEWHLHICWCNLHFKVASSHRVQLQVKITLHEHTVVYSGGFRCGR